MAHFIRVEGEENRQPAFPFICLLVSGGNSQIIRVDSYKNMTVIGQTIDDAAGEAFDKCAKVMGLGYPEALLWTVCPKREIRKPSFQQTAYTGLRL